MSDIIDIKIDKSILFGSNDRIAFLYQPDSQLLTDLAVKKMENVMEFFMKQNLIVY